MESTPRIHRLEKSQQPRPAPQSTPRLTLAQVGRVLGTNSKGRLPSEIENAIFIAIDCEAYEFAQNKTTEIGVSILDVATIANIPPGSRAAAWLAKMKSEHFRIKEFGHLVNKRHVKGNPEAFSFGNSTWIEKSQAKDVLGGIFAPAGPDQSRNIVLVGHGVKNEVAYLNNLDFDLMNAPNVVAIVDTQSIGPGKSQLGLKKLCEAVGMEPQSLHNAGNDAAYTLRALILATILHDDSPTAFESAFRPAVTRVEMSQYRKPYADRDQREYISPIKMVEPVPDGPDPLPTPRIVKSKSSSHQVRKAKWLERQKTANAGPPAARSPSKSD